MKRRDFLKALLTGTAAAALGTAPRQIGDTSIRDALRAMDRLHLNRNGREYVVSTWVNGRMMSVGRRCTIGEDGTLLMLPGPADVWEVAA